MRASAGPWLLALAAVALLHGAALHQAPLQVAMAELPDHEGARVVLAGRVRDVHGDPGWLLLDLTDGEVHASVFATAPHLPEVQAGDEVEAAGVVELRRGAYGLRARGVDVVVRHPADRPAPLAQVAADPGRFEGTPVALEGTLLRQGDRWVLASGDAAVTARFPSRAGLADGIDVRVTGVLRYDASTVAYEVGVTGWRRV